MILGTSKISLILGPIICHFWSLEPRIYGFSYTKILQNILESIWEHLGEILFFHIWQSKMMNLKSEVVVAHRDFISGNKTQSKQQNKNAAYSRFFFQENTIFLIKKTRLKHLKKRVLSTWKL